MDDATTPGLPPDPLPELDQTVALGELMDLAARLFALEGRVRTVEVDYRAAVALAGRLADRLTEANARLAALGESR